jgi:tryptophan halogenase
MEIKTICIVGGGSAGWMSALSIRNNLSLKVNVILVEPKNSKTIGVGESTQPSVTNFIRDYLKLKEEDWMPYCNATYKLGIAFNNFYTESPYSKYHVFTSPDDLKDSIYDLSVDDYYKRSRSSINRAKLAYHMCSSNKFSKNKEQNYAHHLDAALFGEYCKKECVKLKGFELVEGTVSSIQKNSEGIRSIKVSNGSVDREVYADLFIDCTGFSSILTKEVRAPKEDFEPERTLPNDMAIACRLPYLDAKDKSRHINVYTECTGLSSGWVWKVPLWSRIGTGYVYSSKFTTKECAEAEFRDHLIKLYGESRVLSATLSHIPTRPGRRPDPWYNNCVSIGLAAQFLEPLESTGLVFVSLQLEQLIAILNSQISLATVHRDMYNIKLKTAYKELQNFLLLHYISTSRQDSEYWINFRNTSLDPQYIKMLTDIEELGNWEDTSKIMFGRDSWEQILTEFNIVDISKYLHINGISIHKVPTDQILKISDKVQEGVEKLSSLVSRYPTHFEYLKENIYE